jgi:hypothetical protein
MSVSDKTAVLGVKAIVLWVAVNDFAMKIQVSLESISECSDGTVQWEIKFARKSN